MTSKEVCKRGTSISRPSKFHFSRSFLP